MKTLSYFHQATQASKKVYIPAVKPSPFFLAAVAG